MKTLPVDLITQLKQESHTLTFLFKLDLTSTHSYYWTSFDQKISYLSAWWEPKGIQFDEQNVSLLPKADSISLRIDNVDKEFSTLALANEIRGKQVTVYQAALDKNNQVIDSVIIFLGYTDEIEINQRTATVEVYNHLIKWKKLTPRRNHFATCYSDDTEVYTDTGFKLFSQVKIGEKILSLNPDTFDLEYLPAIKLIRNPYKGKMVSIRGKVFNLLVTPDHKLMIVRRKNRFINHKEKVEFIEADKLLKSTGHFYRASKWVGTSPTEIEINGFRMSTTTFCKLMGYYLSEGSIWHKVNQYYVDISQEQQDKLNKIFNDLVELNPTICKGKVSIYNSQIGKYLFKFGKSHDKHIPEDIKSLDKKYLKIFLDAFILGDGNERDYVHNLSGQLCHRRVYITSSPRMASDLGELIIKIGRHPSYYVRNCAGMEHQFKNGIYKINHDCWYINECRYPYADTRSVEKTYIDYDGEVFCITLPRNHTLLVRRKGQVTWCGNCPWVFGDTADEVTGTDALNYRCVISHVSSSSNRPITGSVFTQYWSAEGTHGAVWSSGNEYSPGTCNYYGTNITFNSGGTYEIQPADPLGTNISINSGGTFEIPVGYWIKGNLTTATAYISGINCESGTWANGDYAGHIYLTQTSGIFLISETLTAAVSSNSSSYSPSTSPIVPIFFQLFYSTNAGTVTGCFSSHGDCVLGNISGIRGYVNGLQAGTSGVWADGDMNGAIYFKTTSQAFTVGETLTVSVSSGTTAKSADVATVLATNSTVTWCDQSYDRCIILGNTTNFGGFRWLPGLAMKNIVWGRK